MLQGNTILCFDKQCIILLKKKTNIDCPICSKKYFYSKSHVVYWVS